MTLFQKHRKLVTALLVAAPILLWANQAQSASFDSSATVTYTITSIANLDNPGDHLALDIRGLFELAPPPDSSVNLTGDGAFSNDNPDLGPISIGSSFSQTFAISGSASNGSVDSSHLGLFSLTLRNNGNDRFNIGVKLDYLLKASLTGEYANSEVTLAYLDSAGNFSGSDFVAATFAEDAISKAGTAGILNFTLGPTGSLTDTQELWTDVRIAGHVQTSPVPLPGSLYLMLTGIVSLLGSKRLRA